MSDSNRPAISPLLLHLSIENAIDRSLRTTSKGKALSPISVAIYRITFSFEAFEKEIGEMDPILKFYIKCQCNYGVFLKTLICN